MDTWSSSGRTPQLTQVEKKPAKKHLVSNLSAFQVLSMSLQQLTLDPR